MFDTFTCSAKPFRSKLIQIGNLEVEPVLLPDGRIFLGVKEITPEALTEAHSRAANVDAALVIRFS